MKYRLILILPSVVFVLSSCFQPTAGDDGSQGQQDITSDLLAYYPFNGNADDASGNGNDGVIENATLAVDRDGNADSAYAFTGASSPDSQIRVPAPSLTDPSTYDQWSLNRTINGFTIAAWVELDAVLNTSFPFFPIVMKSNQTGSGANDFMYRMFLGSNGSSVVISIDDWNTSSSGSFTFEADDSSERWYHVASTWDGTTARFYVDGTLIAEEPFAPTMIMDTRDLVIGGDPPGAYESFHGRIDEVRIYGRALTLEQIEVLAEAE